MIKKIDYKNYGELTTVHNDTYFYRKTGTGPQTILIQPAWGSPSAEWWGIQDKLSEFATVITYDRLGYGFSSASKKPRTPAIVSLEMNEILLKLGIQNPVLFIGNSLGCLYIRAFMIKYPDSVKGVILLDPLSPHDNEFKDKLPSRIYKKGGIDKSHNINTIRILQKFHLLKLLKPILMKSPPFFYYKDMSQEHKEVIFNTLFRSDFYKTLLSEYYESHVSENVKWMEFPESLFQFPLSVLVHDPETVIKEYMKYTELSYEENKLIDDIWQSHFKEYCKLSANSRLTQVKNARHFIHMDRADVVIEECRQLLNK